MLAHSVTFVCLSVSISLSSAVAQASGFVPGPSPVSSWSRMVPALSHLSLLLASVVQPPPPTALTQLACTYPLSPPPNTHTHTLDSWSPASPVATFGTNCTHLFYWNITLAGGGGGGGGGGEWIWMGGMSTPWWTGQSDTAGNFRVR
ncbi:hypothetical protein BKA62DRAFT_667400 [Auriculariales sp. MPI-PUGE-AT-0066]|nr:hypothetical protein BKA62DRAFT_667400 [Auriculariales sp. MPI-PUGE-AT-0066]